MRGGKIAIDGGRSKGTLGPGGAKGLFRMIGVANEEKGISGIQMSSRRIYRVVSQSLRHDYCSSEISFSET